MTDGDPPVVTVVVPFLDEVAHLGAAIDSVLAQVHPPSWELILVDDGSTDGSQDVAAGWAADDRRIHVVRHPGGTNRGIVASRNLGLARARGRYLALLDADDQWMPDRLRRHCSILDADATLSMVCGPSHYDRPAGEPSELRVIVDEAPITLRGLDFIRRLLCRRLSPPVPAAVTVRTDAFRAVGGVPAGPDLGEDQRSWMVLATVGAVRIDDQPAARYRVRPDSVYGSHRADPVQRRRIRRTLLTFGMGRLMRGGPRAWPTAATVVGELVAGRLRRH